MSEAAPRLPEDLAEQVRRALHEDIGTGDATAALVPAAKHARAQVLAREPLVLCGRAWVDETFRQLDPAIQVRWQADECRLLPADTTLCAIEGPARAILTGERTALNFLQLLSAVASETRRYADAVKGTGCQVLDTRKTLPGLRTAQKYAVKCGGGRNHRVGLFDMVLIKENHIAAAGGIAAALAAAHAASPALPVEIEVENLAELEIALGSRPDVIMLDDFSLEDMRTAVELNRRLPQPVKIEASGSVSLESLREIAQTGVDYVSVGALTKHVRAIDLSLRFAMA